MRPAEPAATPRAHHEKVAARGNPGQDPHRAAVDDLGDHLHVGELVPPDRERVVQPALVLGADHVDVVDQRRHPAEAHRAGVGPDMDGSQARPAEAGLLEREGQRRIPQRPVDADGDLPAVDGLDVAYDDGRHGRVRDDLQRGRPEQQAG